MALKVLGQASPASATDTDVYSVPTGASAVVSTLTVCNRASTLATIRVAVRPTGEPLASKH